jgi:Ca-activated chloride channel family protein
MQMNVDDPILTAYALGELPEEERARVAADVADSPEAQRYIAEIREFSHVLKAGYRSEQESAAVHRANLIDIRGDRWFWSIARPVSVAAIIAVAALIVGLVFSSKFHGPARMAGMPVTIGTGQRLSLPPAENTPSLEVQGEFAATDPKAPGTPPPMAEVERVIVTGSNIPTAEEVGPNPDETLRGGVKTRGRGKTKSRVALAKAGSKQDAAKIAAMPAAPSIAGSVPAQVAPTEEQSEERFGGIVGQKGDFNTAAYDHIVENPFLDAKNNPLSTFSIDVDTASYSNIRRFINEGHLPPKDAVRLEEMINYFTYDYPQPNDGRPFSINFDVGGCPWEMSHRLVRVGLKGREIAVDKRDSSNLVFLIDVSGSMTPAERLPLIKQSMRLLVEKLTENDRVAIVVYAGASGLALPSTTGDHKDQIREALDRLQAGGSTNGAEGIELAYKIAADNFIKGGVNRVILATDGDFNVGVTNQGDLVRLIQDKARSGVFLSVLGVGTDNLKDSTMQKLADKGNGNYAYLDSLEEGRKVLVEQMNGTLVTIAKDVKIQVEFNPARVASYRLVGYEKRMLRKEDFNNDKIDAGEIGAGHTVTALYEVVPAGVGSNPEVDPLKYSRLRQSSGAASGMASETSDSNEMLTVKLRYKAPDCDKSELTERALVDNGANFANAAPDLKFAAAVAEFGMLLRDSEHKGNGTLAAVLEWAQEGKGSDPNGYRAGFIELVRKAQKLSKS